MKTKKIVSLIALSGLILTPTVFVSCSAQSIEKRNQNSNPSDQTIQALQINQNNQQESPKPPAKPEGDNKQPETPKTPESEKPPAKSEGDSKQPEEPKTPEKQDMDKNPEQPKEPEVPKAPEPEKPKPNWWEVEGEAQVELLSLSSDGISLSLKFKDDLPENLNSKLTLKKEGSGPSEEKTFEFKTTKSKDYKINLGDLKSAKWSVSKIQFGPSTYTPKSTKSFDHKSDLEEYNKIKEILSKLNFNIKEDKKNTVNFFGLESSDFNLGLVTKDRSDIFGFSEETLKNNGISNVDMKITFSPTTDKGVERKRLGTFSIQFLNKSSVFKNIEKSIEWSYKNSQDILGEFVKDNPRYKEFEDYVLNNYFKNKKDLHPFMLQELTVLENNKEVKIADKKINLKEGVVVSLKKFKNLDDYKGEASLVFEVNRDGNKKELEITVKDLAKVNFHEQDYGGSRRAQDFDVKASSSWSSGYPPVRVWSPYTWKNYYWSAGKGDKNPWFEFSWKNGKRGTIYGFELLFWKGDHRYYRKDAYRVEYRETKDGPWKNVNIYPKKAQNVFFVPSKSYHYYRDVVEIKKANIHSVRIVFENGLKPLWPSIFALMPITKV